MAYQRNTARPLLVEEDPLDERLEREVGDPEIDAHDHARDQNDRRALDQLILGRPLDLLQLGPRLGDETTEAAPGRSAGAGLALGLLRRRADLRLALARALRHP